MEEVLHFNVTETPSSKTENGSTPSTPTDLQEIQFWQRHCLDCCRPSRVYARLSNVCKYCNKGLESLNSILSVFSVCRACVLVVLFTANVRFQKLRFPFSSKCTHRQSVVTPLLKECVHLHRANGISAYRKVKDILQEKANITNPLAWVRNNNKSVLCL